MVGTECGDCEDQEMLEEDQDASSGDEIDEEDPFENQVTRKDIHGNDITKIPQEARWQADDAHDHPQIQQSRSHIDKRDLTLTGSTWTGRRPKG